MATSAAQIAANRRNAQHSTGPKTEEGKLAARANALKHGMTSTVVIPGEAADAVALRVEIMQERLAPDDDGMALIMAERAAFLLVRLNRCDDHEAALAAERVRRAEAEFDEARLADADHLMSFIGVEPATSSRRLRATPEGTDLLIRTLNELRAEVDNRWTEFHAHHFDSCCGRRGHGILTTRAGALTRLIEKGDASALLAAEVAAIPEERRTEWALAEIGRAIDDELARLHAHRPTLDFATIAASRAQAGRRASIVATPEAVLFRRYAAATEVAFTRTLRDLRAYRRDQRRLVAAEDTANYRRETQALCPESLEPAALAAAVNNAAAATLSAPPTITAPTTAVATPPALNAPVTAAELASFRHRPLPAPGQRDASSFTIGKPRRVIHSAPQRRRNCPRNAP